MSYKLHTLTKIIDDTVPTYHINNLIESYNKALLKNTDLTMNETQKVLEKLQIC